MDETRRENITQILVDHFSPREEGWMWMALEFDGRDEGLLNQIEGEFTEIGPEGRHHFVHALAEVAPDDVLFLLCRAEGVPREFDREFWRDARDAFAGSSVNIVDMVVFNGEHTYSMRDEDAGRYAAA